MVHLLHRLYGVDAPEAKKSFHRAANSIFAKVGRLASGEVVVELLKCKCLPILLYALDVCNVNKSTMQSFDFTLNRFFMKLFRPFLHTCHTLCCQELLWM